MFTGADDILFTVMILIARNLLTGLKTSLDFLSFPALATFRKTFPCSIKGFQNLLHVEKMAETFSPWQSALECRSCNCGSK